MVSMATFLSLQISPLPLHFSPSLPFFRSLPPRFTFQSPRSYRFPVISVFNNPAINEDSPIPRTLFPGGFKRPEIKVPNLVLQLDPDDVLSGADALKVIDEAVSKRVGIVVLNAGGDASGKTLYDAACSLKSVVRDRAHFLIGERVDIAAAVNASGVLLSDQGLPSIVARNMMMSSKSDSVLLPLVARNVSTVASALNASNSEGADFLIYSLEPGKDIDLNMDSGFTNVKVPLFVNYDPQRTSKSITEASELLESGASGLVLSLDNLRLFDDESLSQLFDTINELKKPARGELEMLESLEDVNNDVHGKKVSGFVNINDRENQLVERERTILLEAINIIKKAAPQGNGF